jgi:hypothetical protein
MNGLLLASGLAFAKRTAGEAMHRAMLGIAAYAMLFVSAFVATGFFTAAGFMYLVETRSAIQTCILIAGIYALMGITGFLLLLFMRKRRRRTTNPPMPSASATDIAAKEGFPGSIASIGLLAVIGYLMGRSLMDKR